MKKKAKKNIISESPLVFVVEDSSAYRLLLERILVQKGFTVKSFEYAVSVLRALETSVPDIIVSDIEMPKMNGFELQERVGREFPLLNIPFLYVSSTNSRKSKAKAGKMGARQMLGKPVTSYDLVSTINDVLQGTPA